MNAVLLSLWLTSARAAPLPVPDPVAYQAWLSSDAEHALEVSREALAAADDDETEDFWRAMEASALVFLDCEAALPQLEDAEESLAEDALARAHVVFGLALCRSETGIATGAQVIALFDEARRIFLLHDRSRDAASSLLESAQIAMEEGRDDTEQRFVTALEVLRALEPDKLVAIGEAYLADIHQDQGRLELAEAGFTRAIAAMTTALGPEHPYTAYVYQRRADCHTLQDELSAARADYVQSLQILERSEGPTSPAAIGLLIELAAFELDELDRPAHALGYIRQALPHLDPEENVGSWVHARTVGAKAASSAGDAAQARAWLDAAASRIEETGDEGLHYGLHHAEVWVDLDQRDLERARRHAELSAELVAAHWGVGTWLWGSTQSDLGLVALAEGDPARAIPHLEAALQIQEALQGADSAALITELHNLCAAHVRAGEREQARQLAARMLALVLDTLDDTLHGMSERERLAYAVRVDHALDMLLLTGAGEDPRAEFTGLLGLKGAAFRTAVKASGSRDGQRLSTLQQRRAQLTLQGASAELIALDREIEQLDAQQERSGAERVDVDAICAALPADSVLVDIARYTDIGGFHYAAFVVDADCSVSRVDLPDGPGIDTLLQRYRQQIRRGSLATSALRLTGTALYEHVWAPMAAAIGDATQVLVSPDGALATLPLAALPTEAGWLIEKHRFVMLDASTELLRAPARRPAEMAALVVGAVDYGPPRAQGTCNRWDAAPLPATATELASVERRLRRRGEVVRLSGRAATEAAVEHAATRAQVVHLATHGIFVDKDCRDAWLGDTPAWLVDPLVLSALLLAGANEEGESDDGVWTAAEVATLALDGTELVVLSACETGLGTPQAGQGVIGLRRALSHAGAGAALISLWAVPDASTEALMTEFYRQLRARRTPAEALHRAQLARIRHLRKTRGVASPLDWAAFVATGTPRPLSRR